MSSPLILRLDVSGSPIRWVPWQEAVGLYAREMVAWTAGETALTFHGGFSRLTGDRSSITVNSIIAVKRSNAAKFRSRATPPLSNHELFRRDGYLCMYCGEPHRERTLTRDHVKPISQGGQDRWSNVVAACKGCNTRKGGRTPEQANMHLLAIPYVPNWAEFLALSNRRILADQMAFLKSQFPSSSRLLQDS